MPGHSGEILNFLRYEISRCYRGLSAKSERKCTNIRRKIFQHKKANNFRIFVKVRISQLYIKLCNKLSPPISGGLGISIISRIVGATSDRIPVTSVDKLFQFMNFLFLNSWAMR